MRRFGSSVVAGGALAGLLGGGIVAAWFFVVDLAARAPFRTPAVLATVVLGADPSAPLPGIVAAYTILHFGVFALLGIAGAALIRGIGVVPGLGIGALAGLGVLTSIHYFALLTTGSEVVGLVPGGHVLLANLLAGIGMAVFIHRAAGVEARIGPASLRGHDRVVRGLITGMVGAGAVALWFLLLDALRLQPFRTPAVLGSALFLGAAEPADVSITPGLVAAYTAVHLAAFAIVGLVLEWVGEQLGRTPQLWLMAVMAAIIVEGLFAAVAFTLGPWILGTLGWWAIGVGNLIAVAAMGGWIWRTHPELQRLVAAPVETWV